MKKIYLSCLLMAPIFMNAQTDVDAIMMSKNNFCFGSIYQYSQWNQYWEGNFKRENLNLGTVSTKSASIMGNYGISDKLNVLFSIPYVSTEASAGTLKGQKGIQDLTLTMKYMPIEKNFGNSTFSLYVLGNLSGPVSNYAADYLPLSIGSKSKVASFRIMTDYQRGWLFSTFSAAYLKRSNIKIERNAYLTNEIHYSNEVDMPDQITINYRIGYRSSRLIAEAVLENWVTQSGGFDITTNNMPFPSNTMNALKIGLNSKYTLQKIEGLSLIAGCNFTADGRNVGQSNTFYSGLFYIIKTTKSKKENEK